MHLQTEKSIKKNMDLNIGNMMIAHKPSITSNS